MPDWEQNLENDAKSLEPTSGKAVAEDAGIAAVIGGVAYEGYEYEQKKKAEAAAQQQQQGGDSFTDNSGNSGY